MSSTCKFQLNKTNAEYFSGETIQGTIVLNTTTPINVRDVRIIFSGEGKVNWHETKYRRDLNGALTTYRINFSSSQVYVDNSSFVCGECTLPPGTHTYTFVIPLPPECPTSLEGHYGNVRYILTLKLNRPFRFDDVFTKPITVIKTNDLNLYPVHRIPVVCEDITTTCCWSCSSGSIFSTFKIPYGAYASGQALNYTLHIKNQTMSDVNGYTIEFRKNICFTAQTPQHKTRNHKSTLYERTYDKACLRLTNQIIEGNFIVPSTPPSTDSHGIISVEYYLNITLHISACCTNSDLYIPIVIGTIPLRENRMPIEHTENFQHVQASAPELPIGDTGNNVPPSYKDLCPPTFEEASRSSSFLVDTEKEKLIHN